MSAKLTFIVVSCLLICFFLYAVATTPWFREQCRLHAIQKAERELKGEDQIQALIRLGALEQIDIPLQRSIYTADGRHVLFDRQVDQTMPKHTAWECTYYSNRLVVVCPPTDMPKWQKLVADYDKK